MKNVTRDEGEYFSTKSVNSSARWMKNEKCMHLITEHQNKGSKT